MPGGGIRGSPATSELPLVQLPPPAPFDPVAPPLLRPQNLVRDCEALREERALTANRVLHGTVALSVGSLFITFYVPWFRESVFDQDTPTGLGWALAAGVTVLFLILAEIYKLIKRLVRFSLFMGSACICVCVCSF